MPVRCAGLRMTDIGASIHIVAWEPPWDSVSAWGSEAPGAAVAVGRASMNSSSRAGRTITANSFRDECTEAHLGTAGQRLSPGIHRSVTRGLNQSHASRSCRGANRGAKPSSRLPRLARHSSPGLAFCHVHGSAAITALCWLPMVRRRSTVRFRKGAPGQGVFS
jgi:hypothetical protein